MTAPIADVAALDCMELAHTTGWPYAGETTIGSRYTFELYV